jgi:hypothetical protein
MVNFKRLDLRCDQLRVCSKIDATSLLYQSTIFNKTSISEMNQPSETNILTQALWHKLQQQIALTQNLLKLLPAGKLHWQPLPGAFRLDDLLGHLLEALAGFCAALYALRPYELAHFAALRQLPVNHRCTIDEAESRINDYQKHLAEGFALLNDQQLAQRLPTLFVKEGETAMTILLGNLEHFINHKYQLFFYLKLLGINVESADLYQFREE